MDDTEQGRDLDSDALRTAHARHLPRRQCVGSSLGAGCCRERDALRSGGVEGDGLHAIEAIVAARARAAVLRPLRLLLRVDKRQGNRRVVRR